MGYFSWITCNIVVVNFHGEPKKHPLYLGISNDDACKLKSTEMTFIACLKWCSWNRQGRHIGEAHNQFVLVETLNDNEVNVLCRSDNSDADNVLLYASEAFVRHYRLDSCSFLGFKIKTVTTPVLLTGVTLCAHTEESYEWVKQLMNYNATHLLVNVCEQPVLCRQGDVCLFPLGLTGPSRDSYEQQLQCLFHLVVVDCQPLLQGLLSPNTSLTIVRADVLYKQPSVEARREDKTSLLTVNHDRNSVQTQSFPHCNRCRTVLNLVSVLLVRFAVISGNTKHAKAVVKLLSLAYRLANSWKVKLNLRVLAKPPFYPSSTIAAKFDPFHAVFVTSAILDEYGLNDFDWVTVSLSLGACDQREFDDSCASKKRYAQVCAIDKHLNDIDILVFGELQDAFVYVTPLLWFNLNCQPSRLIQESATLIMQKMVPCKLRDEGNVTRSSSPLFANEVHVSLIRSQNYDSSVSCDKLLKKYFSVPRLLCPSDVLCLTASNIGDGAGEVLHVGGSITVVYFYVSKIEKQKQSLELGCLVDCLRTSMYQTGIVQSYVPTSMELYFLPNCIHPIWHSPVPCGFKKPCDQLIDIILPYLQSWQLRKSTFPTLCLVGPRSCGKMLVCNAVSTQLNMHLCVVNCWELIGESSGASETRLRVAMQKVRLLGPCLVVLKNIHSICRDNEGVVGESRVVHALKEILTQIMQTCEEHPVFLIGTTTNSNLLSRDLACLFLHYFTFEVPNPSERLAMLRVLTKDVNCGLQISLKNLVQKTPGFVLGDLCSLRSHAVTTAYYRISNLCSSRMLKLSVEDEEDLCLSGIQLLMGDFDEALNNLQTAQSDAIGAPKIPDVKWDDVGGLEYVKGEILDTVLLPLQHPELLATGLRRSGVLLYGPPGTGKTLLAKAVATECFLSFLSVKGPELINMYVGQSEENVRKVFQRARTAAPCIIFFDELDSLAPNRGRSGDSGGVMDRVVSQLLAELDGLHRSADVFIIGATNRPDLLDPALLRPGRFDKLLYVGIASDRSSQLKILEALTRKFHLSEDFNLSEFVVKCPLQLTGADFYALCSDAVFHAMSRRIGELDKGLCGANDLIVMKEDFLKALNNLTPSVSPDELKRYADIQLKIGK